MRTLEKNLSAAQLLKLNCLAVWYRVLEDRALRMDSPDDYHEELLRQADEMDRRGIICWQEWRDLRLEADAAYLRAVAGEDYRHVNLWWSTHSGHGFEFFFSFGRSQSIVELMGPEPVVVAHQVLTNISLSLLPSQVARGRYPL